MGTLLLELNKQARPKEQEKSLFNKTEKDKKSF